MRQSMLRSSSCSTRCCARRLTRVEAAPLLPSLHARREWRQRTSSRSNPSMEATLQPSRRIMGAAIGTTAMVVTGVLAAAGAAAAFASSAQARDPRSLVQEGMRLFRMNKVEEANALFDQAYEASPQLRPYLWQRGLSLYYLGRYADAAEQFRMDVAVNPNDTEESIWCFLSEARFLGPDEARKQFLQVGRDSRAVMRASQEAFINGLGADAIKAAMTDDGSKFYGLLYIALYIEAHGTLQEDAARKAMQEACATPYARLSNDYMAALARVHCLRRGWPLPA